MPNKHPEQGAAYIRGALRKVVTEEADSDGSSTHVEHLLTLTVKF